MNWKLLGFEGLELEIDKIKFFYCIRVILKNLQFLFQFVYREYLEFSFEELSNILLCFLCICNLKLNYYENKNFKWCI